MPSADWRLIRPAGGAAPASEPASVEPAAQRAARAHGELVSAGSGRHVLHAAEHSPRIQRSSIGPRQYPLDVIVRTDDRVVAQAADDRRVDHQVVDKADDVVARTQIHSDADLAVQGELAAGKITRKTHPVRAVFELAGSAHAEPQLVRGSVADEFGSRAIRLELGRYGKEGACFQDFKCPLPSALGFAPSARISTPAARYPLAIVNHFVAQDFPR